VREYVANQGRQVEDLIAQFLRFCGYPQDDDRVDHRATDAFCDTINNPGLDFPAARWRRK
jgi:hypothetical protein